MGGVRTVIVMGPSGCGKSTVCSSLKQRTGWHFVEGDDFHSARNVAKLAAGVPLTDADRLTWLQALRDEIQLRRRASVDGVAIVACSALKRKYRDILSDGSVNVGAAETLFVYLETTKDVLEVRTLNRQGHFVSPKIVASQLEILEPPKAEENAITVNATLSVDSIVSSILKAINCNFCTL